jgi:hypothetical protein
MAVNNLLDIANNKCRFTAKDFVEVGKVLAEENNIPEEEIMDTDGQ